MESKVIKYSEDLINIMKDIECELENLKIDNFDSKLKEFGYHYA